MAVLRTPVSPRRSPLLLASGRVGAAVLLTFVVIWLGTLVVSSQVERSYQGQAVVAFQPRDADLTGAETMTLLTPKYVEVLRSPSLVNDVAAQLGEQSEDVLESSTAELEPNTLNLRVDARAGDPDRAVSIANALAAGAVQRASEDPLISAEIVAWAVPRSSPTPPTPDQILLLGLLVAVAGAAAVGAGIAHLRSRPPQ